MTIYIHVCTHAYCVYSPPVYVGGQGLLFSDNTLILQSKRSCCCWLRDFQFYTQSSILSTDFELYTGFTRSLLFDALYCQFLILSYFNVCSYKCNVIDFAYVLFSFAVRLCLVRRNKETICSPAKERHEKLMSTCPRQCLYSNITIRTAKHIIIYSLFIHLCIIIQNLDILNSRFLLVWGPHLILGGRIKELRTRSGDSCSISVCSSGIWIEPMKCKTYIM